MNCAALHQAVQACWVQLQRLCIRLQLSYLSCQEIFDGILRQQMSNLLLRDTVNTAPTSVQRRD